MEILPGLALSITSMTQARSIHRIIPLDAALRAGMRYSRPAPAEPDDPFWPEVSSSCSLENFAPIKPENRPGRVLSEVALIFGAVGALILALWTFLPGGISP